MCKNGNLGKLLTLSLPAAHNTKCLKMAIFLAQNGVREFLSEASES